MALIPPRPNSGSFRAGWTAVGLVFSILGVLPASADNFMNDQTKADQQSIHTVYFGFGDDSVSPSERQRLDVEGPAPEIGVTRHGRKEAIGRHVILLPARPRPAAPPSAAS